MGLTYPHQGNPSVSVNGGGTNLGLQAAVYGTAAEWTAANPVLGKGELGHETDTGVYKVGDGSTAWASLTVVLNGTYAALIGQSTRNYKVVACALRNDGSGGSYWQPISDANHRPHNVDSVTTNATTIVVDYTSIGAAKMGSVVVVPDETLAQYGFTAGASVTRTQSTITLSRTGVYSDYVSYNGSTWVSSKTVYTASFSAGVLTLTHPVINGSTGYSQDVSVTPRGGTYLTNVTANANATTDTTIAIEFRDHSGTLVTSPDTNMKVFVTHGGYGICDPRTIDTASFPSSNLWVFGIFEV